MGLKEIQDKVHKWISQYPEGYWSPHEIISCLGEEYGEVCREINHLYGHKKKKSTEKPGNLENEICDIIFTLCCLANSHNINLDKAFDKMMKEKLYGRDDNRFKKK